MTTNQRGFNMKQDDTTIEYQFVKQGICDGKYVGTKFEQEMNDIALQLSVLTFNINEIELWLDVATPEESNEYSPISIAFNHCNWEAIRFLHSKGWSLDVLAKSYIVHLNMLLIGTHRTTELLHAVLGVDESAIVNMLNLVGKNPFKKSSLQYLKSKHPDAYESCPHQFRNVILKNDKLYAVTRDFVLSKHGDIFWLQNVKCFCTQELQ